MTEHKEHKPEETPGSAPFTPEQEQRIREIVNEQLLLMEKRQLQERRFGATYPPKEHK